MAVVIGFNRHLERKWLDQVVAWVENGVQGKELRSKVEELLTPFFTSKVAKEKTRNLLLGIWDRLPKHIPSSFQKEAAELSGRDESNGLVVQWGMMIAKYPFFAFIAGQIGRLAKLQNTFSYAQLERRVVEQYGDTETVKRSLRFVVKTMCNLNVLKSNNKGNYNLCSPVSIQQADIKIWLVEAALYSDGTGSRSLSAISTDPFWFPFEFDIHAYEIDRNSKFDLHHQMNDVVVFIK